MFHQPEINRQFVWLNRRDDNTENARPDGIIRGINHKSSVVTLGFCEVEPSDCKSSSLLCSDLLRLTTFSNTVLLRKQNMLVCIQAVGTHCTFYCLSQISSDMTIMLELLEINVPEQISEIGNLFWVLDRLKQISSLYKNQCQPFYTMSQPEEKFSLSDIINPRKRKRSTCTTAVSFTK